MRVAIVTSLGNPIGTNWVLGLQKMGFRIVVLDWRAKPASSAQLANWGLAEGLPVLSFYSSLDKQLKRRIEEILEGQPDLLFGWWGNGILEPLRLVKEVFPKSKVVHVVDTFPNASVWFTELREILQYRAATWIDGYIYYSHSMAEMFCARVAHARNKPYLAMIEPFLEMSYGNPLMSDIPVLKRLDERPHVIFTGRSDLLWTRDVRMRKDAVGPFLKRLARRGIHVFVQTGSDLRGIPNLHCYPRFSNKELFDGRFASFVSQFDAHLVFYNEWNATIRRRVSTGLSTRLAFAMTATAPVACSSRSSFILEYWDDRPFGLMFDNPDDLAERLFDQRLIKRLRANMRERNKGFSFESLSDRISTFLRQVVG